MTTQDQSAAKDNRRKIEACVRDCRAAREAVQAARDILQNTEPDTRWDLQVWALPSAPGELKVTLGGPWGRVPPGFRRKWLLAVADACLDEVKLIHQQEQL